MRRSPLETLAVVAFAVALPLACNSSTDSGGSSSSACASAGGACVLGGATCATQAPASAQDCNPDANPGGAFCCLSTTTTTSDAATTREAATAADASLPACSWPSIYETDAAAQGAGGACFAGRTYLTCTGSNGGGEGCLSDNLTSCPGPNATPGVTYSNCQDVCAPDEYVLVCGTVGPPPGDASPTSNPPAACHISSAVNPSGREPYCCPCSP